MCHTEAAICKCRAAWVGDACQTLAASIVCSTNCSGHGACDVQMGGCVCDHGWEGKACQRVAGAVPVWIVALVLLLTLACAVGCALAAVLAYCFLKRGITPQDALRGHWHVRKEEGWREAEVDGQIPGARFERFVEDLEEQRRTTVQKASAPATSS